jgi:hypothetical protein
VVVAMDDIYVRKGGKSIARVSRKTKARVI